MLGISVALAQPSVRAETPWRCKMNLGKHLHTHCSTTYLHDRGVVETRNAIRG